MTEDSAEERKRKRLEAWRRRQQQATASSSPAAPPTSVNTGPVTALSSTTHTVANAAANAAAHAHATATATATLANVPKVSLSLSKLAASQTSKRHKKLKHPSHPLPPHDSQPPMSVTIPALMTAANHHHKHTVTHPPDDGNGWPSGAIIKNPLWDDDPEDEADDDDKDDDQDDDHVLANGQSRSRAWGGGGGQRFHSEEQRSARKLVLEDWDTILAAETSPPASEMTDPTLTHPATESSTNPAKNTKAGRRWDQGVSPPTFDKSSSSAAAAAATWPSSMNQHHHTTTAPSRMKRVASMAPPPPDALDQFMEHLQAGAWGQVTTVGTTGLGSSRPDPSSSPVEGTTPNDSLNSLNSTATTTLSIHVGGSMIAATPTWPSSQQQQQQQQQQQYYQAADWLSDTTDDEGTFTPRPSAAQRGPEAVTSPPLEGPPEADAEETARRALIEALKAAPVPNAGGGADEDDPGIGPPVATAETTTVATEQPAQLASQVKDEKVRKQERLRELEMRALEVRKQQALRQAEQEHSLGRLYQDDEDGIMEEAEREYEEAQAAPDALQVLAELNKKKELKAVDHSQIDYLPITKNLYRTPRSLAHWTSDQVTNRRAQLKIKVRGKEVPAPVFTFAECGLSELILQLLQEQGITEPFPVQAQCIPCIMAGRDVIGIAKTGSGKTLAYLLPLLRHILVQPPWQPHESGPMALILAPARELAFQIHAVCKKLAKPLGLKSTAVYGGAGVAEQISDLKRGVHIVVATPGRLIDILTMQSGKILSLYRVTFVVMDEADRMYDMGFAPQISAILAAVRPDRQTVLFSATFPKAIETLARKSLRYPIEVIVGSRSVASDNVTQYAEVVEENEKFLRLLQILGEQVEGTKKVIVFVDTQVHADSLFAQLLRNGYPALSLHGGMEQEDRDSTITDFKRKDGPNVLVATGVAGRGLDVPACSCVINYSTPNHLEAYVHQAGRTGRAENKGLCYTFVNSAEEAKFAPIIVRAMSEAGQADNISPELEKLSDEFKAKVEKGEARYAGSGFKGKGFTYDASEMNEAQKIAHLEKRQALIDAGLLDPEDEDPLLDETSRVDRSDGDDRKAKKDSEPQVEIPENLTPELLALPGMKEALLRRAGIIPADNKESSVNDPRLGHPVQMGDNHWVQEFEINDYPREARWKVTQKETTSRLQDEFRTAVTLKGSYFGPGKAPGEGERRLYLHLEATSDRTIRLCVQEIQRILNEETLRVGAKATGGAVSHKYNVLGK